VAFGLLALVLVACQGPSPPPTSEDLVSQAAAALGRGEYARAADLYGRALAANASSVAAHYGLGVASSHLNRLDDTAREFEWVVGNGPTGSVEVENARRWLADRTAPAGSDLATQGQAEQAARASQERQPGHALVEGRAVVADGAGERPAARHRFNLIGQPKSATSPYYSIRADEAGNFRFPNVVPGAYMLTDSIGDKSRATWRLRVEVPASQEVRLDLSPGNSTRVRDDFPNQE
jgi:hypothetical protein